jgi:hypothetical protein
MFLLWMYRFLVTLQVIFILCVIHLFFLLPILLYLTGKLLQKVLRNVDKSEFNIHLVVVFFNKLFPL